jgi:hypothetical protein
MPAFQRSEVTSALVRYLSQHDKGSRVSYRELSDAAGMPIKASTPYLISARRILQVEHAQIWVCIRPGLCLMRLNDAEIAERQRKWFLPGARNKLTNGARQAEVVELSELNMTEQARFAVDSIVREIAHESLSRATARKIERVARGTSNDHPSISAIEWMISLSPPRAPK